MQPESIQIREILKDFYDKVFDDILIGYLFHHREKKELVELQLSFTLPLLGYGGSYQGRPIRAVHRPLKLRKAQFLRRQLLLKEALMASSLDEEIARKWLDLENRLMSHVLDSSSF